MAGEITINLSKFKLAERLTAFKGISEGIIYLGNTDNLSGIAKLKKRALSDYNKGILSYQLKNKNFQFKLEKEITGTDVNYRFFIKHPDLPGKEDPWYWVKNWDAYNIVLFLKEKFNEEGEILIEPDKFEFVFDECNNCIILNKESLEYKNIILENTLNDGIYDVMSKTIKRTPGNLYISKGGNKNYYLGEVWKWRTKDDSFFKEKYQLFTEEIDGEVDNSIEQVLKNKLFSNKLSISEGTYGGKTFGLRVKKNWVNLGPKLEPISDEFDIRDTWEEAVEEYVKRNKKSFSKYSEFYKYEDLPAFIRIFMVTNKNTSISEDFLKITSKIKEVGKEIIESGIFEILYRNYWITGEELPDETVGRYTRLKYKDQEKNQIKELVLGELMGRFYYYSYSHDDGNMEEFAKLLLEKLIGLNIDEIFENTWNKFINCIPFMEENFQSLINWAGRIKTWYSPKSSTTLHQISEFAYNKWSSCNEQQDSFENWPRPNTPNLRSLLLNIYNKSLENSGLGVEDLEIKSYNIGKKDQTHLLTCTITLENIIDYYGGSIEKVPEEIVKELIENRLVEFGIETNNNNFKIKTKS